MYSDIVILNGSPKKAQGNTALLCQPLIKGFIDAERKVSEVFLYNLSPNFCKGCHSCWNTGLCVYNDDITALIAKIMKSQLIIWATPLYFCSMSAFTKMVLERISPFISPLIEKGPQHQDRHHKTNIPAFGLFSTCFYANPEHFDNLCQLFNAICVNMNVDYTFELCIPAAPFLISNKDKHSKYFETSYNIGKFYGTNGIISKDLKNKLSEPISNDKTIIESHNKLFL